MFLLGALGDTLCPIFSSSRGFLHALACGSFLISNRAMAHWIIFTLNGPGWHTLSHFPLLLLSTLGLTESSRIRFLSHIPSVPSATSFLPGKVSEVTHSQVLGLRMWTSLGSIVLPTPVLRPLIEGVQCGYCYWNCRQFLKHCEVELKHFWALQPWYHVVFYYS